MCRKLLFTFLVTQLLCSFINGDVYPECGNVADGNFIAVASNCSKAIYCDGEDSSVVECDYDRPYFSPNDQSCYTASSICGNRPFGGGNVLTTTVIPRPSILTKPTTIGASSTASTTAASTPSLSTTIATIPTTTVRNSTTWSPMVTTSTTTVPSSSLTCPPLEDPTRPVFLPHPKSCSQYYLCYHGVATLMQCPNMLHFDVNQQSCNTAEKVNCQISAIIPRDQCLPQTVDLYPHASNCNYYYLCEYGYLMVMQCPFNMGWDYEKRACVVKSMAKCYNEALMN